MGKFLSAQQIADFSEQGFVSPLPLLDPAGCEALLQRIASFESRRAADLPWAFDIKCNLLFDWVYQLGAQARTLDAVEDLLGPCIYNTNSVFRIKEPGTSTAYGWHQDAARIDVNPCFLIVFVALTESTPRNGGLSVLPGSHRRVLPFELHENHDGQAKRKVARTLDVAEEDTLALSLAPGEATVFSGRLVHGSGPNHSHRRRVAILTDYTGAQSRQSRGTGSGQLLRGVDRWGHIAAEPVPLGDCREVDVERRREILRRYPQNPLMGPLAAGEVPQFPDREMAL